MTRHTNAVPRFMTELKAAFELAHNNGMRPKDMAEEIAANVKLGGMAVEWNKSVISWILRGSTRITRKPADEAKAITQYFKKKYAPEIKAEAAELTPTQLIIPLKPDHALALAAGIVNKEDIIKLVEATIANEIASKVWQKPQP